MVDEIRVSYLRRYVVGRNVLCNHRVRQLAESVLRAVLKVKQGAGERVPCWTSLHKKLRSKCVPHWSAD